MNIYDYTDYREFLKDHFEFTKTQKSFYSFRYLAQKTGIDPSFYSKIIHGSKHLSSKQLPILIEFLELSESHSQFFQTLYQYNRSNQPQVCERLLKELNLLRQEVGIQISNFDYFSEWYVIPLRELLNHYDYKDKPQVLAQLFHPPLKEAEVERALRILLELQMIARNEEGFLKPVDQVITTGTQWQSLAIREFQRQMIQLGAEAIERWPKEQRDISTLTISTSQATLETIQERLTLARKEILDLIQQDESVEGVYQINMQVFPLTKEAP